MAARRRAPGNRCDSGSDIGQDLARGSGFSRDPIPLDASRREPPTQIGAGQSLRVPEEVFRRRGSGSLRRPRLVSTAAPALPRTTRTQSSPEKTA